ncbi:hypothetical protein GCM10029964_035730 [Kibdelosporangium lantanae]
MTAVTVLNGNVLAVGHSVDRQPRAWVYAPGDKDFTPSTVEKDGQGEIEDVATIGSTAVAVGWTGLGTTVRPAVWTSTDGRTWTLQLPANDFRPGTLIKQLTAITTTPDNRLLVIARDDRQDKEEGDSTAYTSGDGKTWLPLQTTGLSGSGPQEVDRLIRTDGTYVALGSVLDGAKRGPAIWTSTDGAKWDLSPYVPQGQPNLQGIVRQADGKLLVCGSIGSGEPPPLSCWTQKPDQSWERWDVTVDDKSPRPVLLYGMFLADQSIVVVGFGQPKDGKGTNDASMWTLKPGTHK